MEQLPLLGGSPRGVPWLVRMILAIACAAGISLALLAAMRDGSGVSPIQPQCPQLGPLKPAGNDSWISRFENRVFALEAAERLAGAVRIPTESSDASRGMPPPPKDLPDPVHKGFDDLHKYLERTFLLVRKHLTRTVIQRYALLYTWEGSETELPPLVLMAHQDVVPVLPETLWQWTYPPYSGFVDVENDFIWGRGSVDTKGTLVGILEAIEALLENGFAPRKTIYLAFGYDEEISGIVGARHIAKYMEEELGLAGKVGLIVDEGLDSLTTTDGINLAVVSTAEKGYLDYHVTVETTGGHSSVPPKHTGIGLAALLISALESKPHPILLTQSNPYLGTIACVNEHSLTPDAVISKYLKNFKQHAEQLASYLSDRSLKDRYRMASSQAIDVIVGGLKVNALPELVMIDTNNRISIDSSISEFEAHISKALLPVAKKYGFNLTLQNFLKPNDEPFALYLTPNAIGNVSVFEKETDSPLEPSPISPHGSKAWNIVEGTIHHVYERQSAFGADHDGEKQFIVAPGLMAGNTDTRYFWNLSNNIMRFAPAPGGFGYHTVNERASIKGYMTAVTFFHELIRNYDQS